MPIIELATLSTAFTKLYTMYADRQDVLSALEALQRTITKLEKHVVPALAKGQENIMDGDLLEAKKLIDELTTFAHDDKALHRIERIERQLNANVGILAFQRELQPPIGAPASSESLSPYPAVAATQGAPAVNEIVNEADNRDDREDFGPGVYACVWSSSGSQPCGYKWCYNRGCGKTWRVVCLDCWPRYKASMETLLKEAGALGLCVETCMDVSTGLADLKLSIGNAADRQSAQSHLMWASD